MAVSDTDPQTTGNPWDGNRGGDPRQLLLEAVQMEASAEEHLRIAEIYLNRVAAEHAAARRLKHAAADYRQWAAEQGETAK
jgi:hypothetical protein